MTVPELDTAATFDASSDVYALGAMLAFALTGSRSWLTRVRAQEIPDGLAHTVTAPTRALLAALTAPDPRARPTAAGACDWAAVIRGRLHA